MMVVNARHALSQGDDTLSDRVLQRIRRGRVMRDIQQDPFHTFSPGIVLCPQMGQLLPDAHVVWVRRAQGRFIQHVERDIWQFFHSANSTRRRRLLCA